MHSNSRLRSGYDYPVVRARLEDRGLTDLYIRRRGTKPKPGEPHRLTLGLRWVVEAPTPGGPTTASSDVPPTNASATVMPRSGWPRRAAFRCMPGSQPGPISEPSLSDFVATSPNPRWPTVGCRSPVNARFVTHSRRPGAMAPLTLCLIHWILLLIVVGVEELAGLVAVHRDIGAVEIQHDFIGWFVVLFVEVMPQHFMGLDHRLPVHALLHPT